MCYLNCCLGRYPEVKTLEFPTSGLLIVKLSPMCTEHMGDVY